MHAGGPVVASTSSAAKGPRVRVSLELGGEFSGTVLEQTDGLIVIQHRGRPCAFTYDEMRIGSAIRLMRRHLNRAGRGLTAEGHFTLGRYALDRGSKRLAREELDEAARIDQSYADGVAQVWREHTRQETTPDTGPADLWGVTDDVNSDGRVEPDAKHADPNRDKVLSAYRAFGREVADTLDISLELIETSHFLVWTDWPELRRRHLGVLCERMYDAVARQLAIADDQHVFVGGKCPIFCFRSKARFLRFARTCDGWNRSDAAAYTRTTPEGYAHVVIYLRSSSSQGLRSFAGTLVHECVHAMLLNYGQTWHITGWLAEGLAEYTAEQVLGDACPYGEKAAAVARQIVQRNLSLRGLLRSRRMPDALDYPVAHSVVEYLIERDAARFRTLLKASKELRDVDRGLKREYGLSLVDLEANWREWVREAMRRQPDQPA